MARDMHVVGRQVKRGKTSEHLRHPCVISGQFESLRGLEFILLIYTTLIYIDPLSYRPSLCDFLLLGVSHYRHGDQNNCKAELLVTCSLIRGSKICSGRNLIREQKRGSRVKFGTETIDKAYEGPGQK
jgi:hypothetical protein